MRSYIGRGLHTGPSGSMSRPNVRIFFGDILRVDLECRPRSRMGVGVGEAHTAGHTHTSLHIGPRLGHRMGYITGYIGRGLIWGLCDPYPNLYILGIFLLHLSILILPQYILCIWVCYILRIYGYPYPHASMPILFLLMYLLSFPNQNPSDVLLSYYPCCVCYVSCPEGGYSMPRTEPPGVHSAREKPRPAPDRTTHTLSASTKTVIHRYTDCDNTPSAPNHVHSSPLASVHDHGFSTRAEYSLTSSFRA